jgi:hypothetical protein
VSGERPEQGRRLLEEALRLIDVVQATGPGGWRPDGSRSPDGVAESECSICPLCRGIAHLRQVDPGAVERLTGAVADAAAAVRDLLGATSAAPAQGADQGGGARGTAAGAGGLARTRVQQIDVTD